ncbi:MAG TPA: carboxypeptidase-like regulatory domain-containing protein [Bryobacteraceae bacterium]|nr:carboxypeptidase-like regulatory domain-containing protein [Bryobacteraceae bacterium]
MRLVSGLVCLLLVPAAFGQGTRGAISGTVTDPDGKPIANAQVQAKNQSGGQFQTKVSASGSYSLTELPAGTYQVTVASPGLMPFTKENVSVPAVQTVRLDAKLSDFPSLGAVGEDRQFYAGLLGSHDAPAGPAPRTPDGKPDFSGVWHTLRTVEPAKPDALPWAEELSKERLANNLKDLPGSRCLPGGITRDGRFFGFRIMQNQTVLAFLYEEDLPRQIYLDGRKHPEESLSPFIGHSVGKWDGDTLVVDTVGFNDQTWLDAVGHPHTGKMRITERFRRKDLGHLDVETTIDDPGAYKKPWTIKETTELAGEGDEVGQYVCTENNRDVQHLVGK